MAIRVRYTVLPSGSYDVESLPAYRGTMQWEARYSGHPIAVRNTRDDAIMAAWVHASKRFKQDLARAPMKGWGKLGTAERILSDWASSKRKAKRYAKVSPKHERLANQLNRKARELKEMMK